MRILRWKFSISRNEQVNLNLFAEQVKTLGEEVGRSYTTVGASIGNHTSGNTIYKFSAYIDGYGHVEDTTLNGCFEAIKSKVYPIESKVVDIFIDDSIY